MQASNAYTMRDVARLARVSVTTVSKIVNGRGGVSPRLAQRVEAAIEALDFHPNEVARNLKINRTATIGMVVPHISNPFFANVFRGAEEEARRHGLSLVLCNSNEDVQVERDLLRMLICRRVEGILLASASESLAPPRRYPPLICFDREPAGFNGRVVVIDNEFAGYEAARHLIELGHRRIAIISGPETKSTGALRLRGFRNALQEANLPMYHEYLQTGDFSLEAGYRAGIDLLHLSSPPTAVFACNNEMTLGLMLAIKDSGLKCPEHMSVVGFDRFDWFGLLSPTLTTVIQPSCEMGKRAMESLLQLIRVEAPPSPSEDLHRVVLKAELRLGESTARLVE
jgi:LacI family transcriptional regulator